MSESLTPDESRILEELEVTCRKPLSHINDEQLERWELARLGRQRFPTINSSRDAIRRLLQSAVDNLPEGHSRYKDAARVMLGLAPNSGSLSVGVRQRRAAELLHIPFDTFRTSQNHIPRLRRELRDCIMRNAQANEEAVAEEFAPESRWVERPLITGRLNHLIADGRPIIGIYGAPGVGKSRLAEEVSYGESVLALDASNSEFLHSSILRHVKGRSEPEYTFTYSQSHAIQLLCELLLSERSPRFLILDNATSLAFLGDLGRKPVRATIIAISRTMLPEIRPRDQIIVGALESDEAIQLARVANPDLASKDAETVAREMGNHPLAIKALCALLRLNPDLSIESLVSSVNRAPQYTLRGLPQDAGTILYETYRRTIETVTSQNALSAVILQHAAMLAPADIDSKILTNSACSQLGIGRLDIPIASTQAFRVLYGNFLLEPASDEGGCRLHSITRLILRDLYRDTWDVHLVVRLIGAILAACRTSPEVRAKARYFLEANEDLIWHLYTVAIQPSIEMNEIEAMMARFGRAVQLIAKAVGVDRRLVLPLALSLKPGTFQISVHFLSINNTNSGPRLGLSLAMSGGKHLHVDLTSSLSKTRVPTLLIEWNSDEHELIRVGELQIEEAGDQFDYSITAASEEDVERLADKFANPSARVVEAKYKTT